MPPLRVELAAQMWAVKRPHRSDQVKAKAVSMYSDGSSMEAISRVIGVKSGTVDSWGKKPVGLGNREGFWWRSGGGVKSRPGPYP